MFSLALTCIALAGFTGCGSRETNVASGDATQTLHFGNLSEPTDLDPHVITSLQDFNIVLSLFEGLTQYDPQDSHATPGVATHWEPSADLKTWTFHLRPDAKWSNGDPVTAEDFAYAYQRMLSPKFASEYAYMLFCLDGAEAYLSDESTDFATVGVKVVDDHTLQLQLAYPVPCLPDLIAHASWDPVHKATIETYGAMDQRGSRWTRPGNLVGNGPFVLSAWKPQPSHHRHQIQNLTGTPLKYASTPSISTPAKALPAKKPPSAPAHCTSPPASPSIRLPSTRTTPH
ncbi:MAG: hypothetical protein J6386_22985 [Candidatus Synoicihabitans palmerolidicus]|nr:hypothetical protein [Candidatus Synoicihabitans palmerolidicus]